MKRSDLYKKVWSTPMTKLAAELGISDVGLAKACLRHAVPVPHRGYWAKLRAGQRPKQTPLASLQPQVRAEREVRQAEERRVEGLKARMDERRRARAEQVKQAFLMMDADARVGQLRAFLDRLEERGPSLRKPFSDRLAVWVQVVRRELSLRNPADEVLEGCLSVQSWETWPPAWWPEEPDQAT